MDRRTFLERFGLTAAGAVATRKLGLAQSLRSLQPDSVSSGTACDDIALFGVASDGSIGLWDGTSAPRGILLRWFEKNGVDFPDYGYDLYRAPVPKATAISFDDATSAAMQGERNHQFQDEVLFSCDAGFDLSDTGTNAHSLVVKPNAPVVLRFPEPAWYVLLRARAATTSLSAKAYSGGMLRLNDTFGAAMIEWFTKGIERVEFVGTGKIEVVAYRLVCAKAAKWTHLRHFCLPVTDPAYPCGPRNWSSDEDEAKKRLPPAVQSTKWSSKYQLAFREMYSTLKAIATNSAVPPFPAASDPDAPVLGLAPEDGLRIATLDPHVARMLGTAYDDALDPSGLDGNWYAYKITGRWACETKAFSGESLDPKDLQKQHGIKLVRERVRIAHDNGALQAALLPGGVLRFRFPVTLESLALRIKATKRIRWLARDAHGTVLSEGKVPTGFAPKIVPNLTIEEMGIRWLEFQGEGTLEVVGLWWSTPSYVERVGVLPGIRATATGAPLGPDWITARVQQPGGCNEPIESLLDWQTRVMPQGASRPEDAIFYQVAGTQTGADPTAARPATPAFKPEFVLRDGDFIIVPPEISAAPSPRALLTDRDHDGAGLREGWRAWWVRGVDMFGRVSRPSLPDIQRIEDLAQPPAPIVVLAEYVQSNLPDATPRMLSALGREWLSVNPRVNAMLVAWAWTPELNEQCWDVDGFKCYVRRPDWTSGNAEYEAAVTYEGAGWGTAVGNLGPTSVHFDGTVRLVQPGLGAVTVNAVQPLDSTTWAVSTGLALDVGAGALSGGTMRDGTATYDILGNSDGANVTLYVRPVASAGAPTSGSYTLDHSSVARITTTMAAPSDPAAFRRRFGGVLAIGSERYLVMRESGGSFTVLLAAAAAPAVNAAVSWFPAYVFVLADTGQGPQPSLTLPVAHAQITATSVRRSGTRPVESGPANPGTLTAVDTTVPTTPTSPAVPSGAYCTELATRPDWYGISRYSPTWTSQPNLKYNVYRALGDAIVKLDAQYHDQASPRAHNFTSSSWPTEIWNDAGRRAGVNTDLATLDTDLAVAFAIPAADPRRRDERRGLIAGAYAKLHADAQRVIANQDHVRPAYVARNKLPLSAADLPYVDEFDGRAKARWFYRVASRTPANIESPWTTPSPPICAPDVVPPTTPQVQVALAAIEQVKLRWIVSPERDVAKYRLYRAGNSAAAADIPTMTQIASIAPAPTTTPPTGMVSPVAIAGKTGWLEFAAAASPAGDWYFRLVAEDAQGNQSAPSGLLHGRSLRAVPTPPTWTGAQRAPSTAPTQVSLQWSHPTDPRLSCAVERRAEGEVMWQTVSDWLPRGVYQFVDTPKDISVALDYRLRARDSVGQVSSQSSTASLTKL